MVYGFEFERSWQLKKFAKTKFEDESSGDGSSKWSTSSATQNQPIKLLITSVLQMTFVKNEDEILASFNLWNAESKLMCIYEEDCVLIAHRYVDSKGDEMTRRIRAKFSDQSGLTASEACKQFTEFIKDFIPVHTRKAYCDGNEKNDEERYIQVDKSEDKIIQCVKSCLSDPEFPDFVLNVEKILNDLSEDRQ